MVALILLLSAFFIFMGVYLIIYFKRKARKKETSDWQVGDMLIIYGENNMVSLVGWSNEAFYINADGAAQKVEWEKFRYNKSAVWRRNYKSCEEYMGAQPGFKPSLKDGVSPKSKINDKPIELLTEIECQIYLKKALDEENYELADAIRKQMEKYR